MMAIETQIPALTVSGIDTISSRDAGTGWQYVLRFRKDGGIDQVVSLLRALRTNHEVTFEVMATEEAYNEVRATDADLQIRTSHHGSMGTWRRARFDEAVEHMRQCLPTNEVAWLHHRGTYWIPKP
jgi:hypothetical protein